jgi:hypothetical protein
MAVGLSVIRLCLFPIRLEHIWLVDTHGPKATKLGWVDEGSIGVGRGADHE